jgi:hypothetical protein
MEADVRKDGDEHDVLGKPARPYQELVRQIYD